MELAAGGQVCHYSGLRGNEDYFWMDPESGGEQTEEPGIVGETQSGCDEFVQSH